MAVDARVIGLVGCGKRKAPTACRARDLYCGPLFVKRVRYVDATCDRWYIVSALHGLLSPDTIVEPYDVTLIDADPDERRRWATRVVDQLATELGDLGGYSYEIHAGVEYRDYGLADALLATGATVMVPTEGLRLGKQYAFYKGHATRLGQETLWTG